MTTVVITVISKIVVEDHVRPVQIFPLRLSRDIQVIRS